MNPQAIRNLKFVQGETLLMRIAAANSGTGIDMTGYSFSGQIRGNTNLLLANFGFDTSALQSGQVTAIIDRIVSAGIPAGLHKYDIFATSLDGVATVIAKGIAEVSGRVTA